MNRFLPDQSANKRIASDGEFAYWYWFFGPAEWDSGRATGR